MMLVTLDEAKAHLRLDTTDGDSDILLKVKAASRAVVTYLKNPSFSDSSGAIPEDSAGIALDVPEDVKIATLMLIGYFDRQRDEDGGREYEPGSLPRPVTALLFPYRVPTYGFTNAQIDTIESRRRRHWWWWR